MAPGREALWGCGRWPTCSPERVMGAGVTARPKDMSLLAALGVAGPTGLRNTPTAWEARDPAVLPAQPSCPRPRAATSVPRTGPEARRGAARWGEDGSSFFCHFYHLILTSGGASCLRQASCGVLLGVSPRRGEASSAPRGAAPYLAAQLLEAVRTDARTPRDCRRATPEAALSSETQSCQPLRSTAGAGAPELPGGVRAGLRGCLPAQLLPAPPPPTSAPVSASVGPRP